MVMALLSSILGRSKLEDILDSLIDTALGKKKADLVLKNCSIIDVYSGEIIEKSNIAVKDDRIVLIGNVEQCVGENTLTFDLNGKYVAPGFIDAHVHIESSMLTPSQFASAVLPRGTTCIFADPHEIANVLGVKGVKLFLEEAKNLPLKVLICAPSCVPAVGGEFETAGAYIGPKEIEELLLMDGVVALAEMMNYPGVLFRDKEVLEKIRISHRLGKPVDGHAPGLLDENLCAYMSAGITSCHESTTELEGVQKLRLGMYLMIREGSAWKDLAEVIKAVTKQGLNHRRAVLVTDDRHPSDLIREGHMDHVVRRGIEEGLDPVAAIQMATLNPAERYGLDLHIGGIAPPRYADLIVLSDLEKVHVDMVFADGKLVAKDGKLIVDVPRFEYPDWAKKTVKIKESISADMFVIKAPIEEGVVKTRVIGVIKGKATTKHLIVDVNVKDWKINVSTDEDLVKIAVIDRHKASGSMGLGLVKGFGIKQGGVASTIAHDSHNLIVLGVDENDMALAANKVVDSNGGMAIAKDGKIVVSVELPIAGIITDENFENLCIKVEKFEEAWKEIGCTISAPFMTMSLLALPVIPELRITDKGLIDVVKFQKVSLFA
jgi:adenine deaminase